MPIYDYIITMHAIEITQDQQKTAFSWGIIALGVAALVCREDIIHHAEPIKKTIVAINRAKKAFNDINDKEN